MELEAMGWRVVEVWEREVRGDPAGVVRRIWRVGEGAGVDSIRRERLLDYKRREEERLADYRRRCREGN